MEPTSEVKPCVTCHYARNMHTVLDTHDSGYFCTHPATVDTSKISPVTGQPYFRRCNSVRDVWENTDCGPSAKFWTAPFSVNFKSAPVIYKAKSKTPDDLLKDLGM